MLLEILANFKGATPFKEIVLDDKWDQINRCYMFLLCVIFGTVVTFRQYTGGIIACDGLTKFSAAFAEDYCWTQGLYTIKEAYDIVDNSLPYPGLLPEDAPPCLSRRLVSGGRIECPPADLYLEPTRVHHTWYQWIPFYFWVISIAFIGPYIVYKQLGVNELKPILAMLHNPVDGDDVTKDQISKVSRWLAIKLNIFIQEKSTYAKITQSHRMFILIFLTKIFYLGVSLATMYFTDTMFESGRYLTYGSEWFASLDKQSNYTSFVRDRLFPKMVACEIKRWGPSGMEEEQGMCVLAPNVMNQYLFLIFWFALVFTIFSNTFSIFFSVSTHCFIDGGYQRFIQSCFLKENSKLKFIYFNCGTTGRTYLHLIAKNVNPRIFEQLIIKLSADLVEEKNKQHLKGSKDILV
ncbi:hypothetical protein ACHWQZ_G001792 [Mnemiopsis leidyi]